MDSADGLLFGDSLRFIMDLRRSQQFGHWVYLQRLLKKEVR